MSDVRKPQDKKGPHKKKESILDLAPYLEKRMRVKFNGGREASGVLKGYDALLNLVLDGATEYLKETEETIKTGRKTRQLGLVVCRGTNIVTICPQDGIQQIANPFLQPDQYGDDYVRKADEIGIEMRKTDGAGLNYRDKYYALRRTTKELIFENSAYQAEILECQKMIAQRERERELLLQHLLQYEQEAWELQSEMNNAHSEKHKLLKKQQEADKRKRVRLDTHLAEAAAIAQTETDGNVSKIPKIKIVFQHKGPGIAPSGPQESSSKVQSGPALDMNTEAKAAIKNKIKRNKLEPIVISLPSASVLNKDPLHQQTVKRPRPSNLGLNLSSSGLLAASRSGLILSPSLLSTQHGALPYSPGLDLSEILARTDHTPVDIFSESDTSSAPSSANLLLNNPLQEERLVPGIVPEEQYSMLSSFKRSPDVTAGSFRISPSALRSIKQKIDSINNSQSPWKTKRSPSSGIPDTSKKSND